MLKVRYPFAFCALVIRGSVIPDIIPDCLVVGIDLVRPQLAVGARLARLANRVFAELPPSFFACPSLCGAGFRKGIDVMRSETIIGSSKDTPRGYIERSSNVNRGMRLPA